MTPLKPIDAELELLLAEFRRDGSLIREKARLLTEDGLEELYRRMHIGDTTTSTFLDIMKYLAEVGDLKPKQSTTPSNQGAGFSITINIPQANGEPPITLEAIPVTNEGGDVGEVPLGDIPIRQLGRTFDNTDLMGGGDE